MGLTSGDIGDCCCCSVKFLTQCAGAAEPDVAVTITQGTPPRTIASGMSDADGKLTLDIQYPGVYQVTASSGVGMFSATMALACGRTYTLDVCEVTCCWEVQINTYNIQGLPPMPASGSVTISGNSTGGSASATVPTNTAVVICLPKGDPDPAHYTITVSYGGQSQTYISFCGEIVGWDAYPNIVSGCLGGSGAIGQYGLPGCTVTYIGSGRTQTTDANGMYFFLVGPGSPIPATVTVTEPSGKFLPYTGGMGSVSLSPSANYVCTNCCNIPICKQLSMTDNAGNATLVYGWGNADVGPFASIGPFQGPWFGLMSANAPAACNCPGGNVPVLVLFGISGSPGFCTAALTFLIPVNAPVDNTDAWHCWLCIAGWPTTSPGPPYCPGLTAAGTVGTLGSRQLAQTSTSCDPFQADYTTPISVGCFVCSYLDLDPVTGDSTVIDVDCAAGGPSPTLIWGPGPLVDITTITEAC